MLERLAGLETEFADVEARLADPDVFADQARYRELATRHKELDAIVSRYRELRHRTDDLELAKQMLSDSAGDDREFARTEAETAAADIERLEAELKVLLLPTDPNDDRNVIVEIRGAEGGEEANLFARDLFQMYQGFAATSGMEARGPRIRSVTDGRVQRDHVPGQRRRRLDTNEARSRPAPRAARARHGIAGPDPHLVGHGDGVARSRGGRCRDRRMATFRSTCTDRPARADSP